LIIERLNTVIFFVDDIDSGKRPNPYSVIVVFCNRLNTVIGKPVRIRRARSENLNTIAVKTAQSVLTTKPHITFFVVIQAIDRIGGQLVNIGKVLETKTGGTAIRTGRKTQAQYG